MVGRALATPARGQSEPPTAHPMEEMRSAGPPGPAPGGSARRGGGNRAPATPSAAQLLGAKCGVGEVLAAGTQRKISRQLTPTSTLAAEASEELSEGELSGTSSGGSSAEARGHAAHFVGSGSHNFSAPDSDCDSGSEGDSEADGEEGSVTPIRRLAPRTSSPSARGASSRRTRLRAQRSRCASAHGGAHGGHHCAHSRTQPAADPPLAEAAAVWVSPQEELLRAQQAGLARQRSDQMLAGFMAKWHTDNRSGDTGAPEQPAAGGLGLGEHPRSKPLAFSSVSVSKDSPTVLEPLDMAQAAVQHRLDALTRDLDLCYAIFWRSEEDHRATRAAAVAVSSPCRFVAARAAEEAGARQAPGVLLCGGASVRSFDNCNSDLYSAIATRLQGFSFGLGMVGRVAWTRRHEWYTDLQNTPLPNGLFHRLELAVQTGMATVAVVPSGCGVIEVGTPIARSEDGWAVRRIATCMDGL